MILVGYLFPPDLGDSSEELVLFGIEVGWNFDLNGHDQITPSSASANIWHSSASQSKLSSGLGGLRDHQVLDAIECLKLQRSAKNRLGKRYGQLAS